MHRRAFRSFVVVLSIVTVIAGCSGSNGPSPSAATGTAGPPSTSPAASADASASAAPSEAPGTKTFALSGGDKALGNVPTMAAMESLNSAGYQVTLPIVKDVSLSVDGMTRGDFQFGYGAVNAYMTAIQKGATIKIISEAIGNEWQFYSAAAVASCANLDGKKLAISSEGGVSTALTKAWMASECPDAKPTFLVISNSADRQLALLSGQVDASPLQIQDGLALATKGGDKFHQLADFRTLLPEITTTVLTVSDQWAKENPGSVQALLKADLASVRQIIDDPAYMQQEVDHLKNDLSATYDPSVVEAYRGQWDPNGGISADGFQSTIDFFTNSGAIEPGLTVDKALDLSYLNAVLDQIGRR